MSAEQIQRVIESYFSEISCMNGEGWVKNFAGDAIVCDPVGKPPMKIHEEFEKFFAIITRFYDSLEVTPEDIFIAGNGAAVKWKMKVAAKNGKQGIAEGIGVFEFNDEGKIQKLSSYWDEATLLAQISDRT